MTDLTEITDTDIFELAQLLDGNFKYGGKVNEIRRGNSNDEAWTILFWENKNSMWNTGMVYVSNSEVYFSNYDTNGDVHIGFSEIQWLLDRGYEIFKTSA